MSRSKQKKSRRQYVVLFKFSDGEERLTLAEFETQQLNQCHAMASSDDPQLRVAGKKHLKATAERLAASRGAEVQRSLSLQKATPRAAEARRKIGGDKAARVSDDIAKGRTPPASARHVRRIRNSK